MLHFPRWKSLSIIGAVILALIVALPNVLPGDMREKLKAYGLGTITLGLDLQGGSNILLEIDRNDLRNHLVEQLTGDIRSSLREGRIAYSGINRFDNGVRVRISKAEDVETAKAVLKKAIAPVDAGLFGAGAQPSLFDLSADGQQLTFTFNDVGIDGKVASAVSQSIKIVEKRINPDGIIEATIRQQGKDRITIQLPGLQNSDEIKSRLDKTAKLTFQLL